MKLTLIIGIVFCLIIIFSKDLAAEAPNTSPLKVTISILNSTCGKADGSASAKVTGGTPPYHYNWDTGETADTIGNLSAGSYALMVTDGTGSVTFLNFNIKDIGAPDITVTKTDPTCFGDINGKAIATATGGARPYSYSWSNGKTDSIITGVGAGLYEITVKDRNNCAGLETVVINHPDTLSLQASAMNANCNVANGTALVQVIGGTSPYSYLWNDGQTRDTALNLPAGSYRVIVTDKNACVDSTVIIVNEKVPFILNFGKSDVSCSGGNDGMDTIKITGGTPPFSYSWSSSGTEAIETGLSAGIYTVTVKDNSGCTTSGNDTIDEPSRLSLIMGMDRSSCGNADGSAYVSVAGGTSPYTYSWSDGQTTDAAVNLVSGTYKVNVMDDNRCVESNRVVVIDSSSMQVNIAITDATYYDSKDIALVANVSGGKEPYKYFWSSGGTESFEAVPSTGVYTLTVRDSDGCLAFDFLSIDKLNK